MIDQGTSILPQRTVYGAFWPRVAAYLLDAMIVSIPAGIIVNIIGYSSNMQQDYMLFVLYYYTILALAFTLYYSIMESSRAQASVGKMALKLKVTDMHGNRLTFGRSLGRCLAKFISTFLLLIGFIMVGWDSKKQGLHDKIAGTLVVKTA